MSQFTKNIFLLHLHVYKSEESTVLEQIKTVICDFWHVSKQTWLVGKFFFRKSFQLPLWCSNKKYGHTVKMCNDWQVHVHNQGFYTGQGNRRIVWLQGWFSPPGLTVAIILLLNETPELHWKLFWLLIPVDKIPWQGTKVSRPVLQSI